MTPPDSRTVVERYIAAAESRDEPALRASFAEDATWWLRGELPISGTWRGRDTIIDEFLPTAMSFYQPDSVSIEVTGLTAEGETVVAEWTSRARTTDGAPYENHCIGVFSVRDGEITSVREYMDTLYASQVAFGSGRAVTRT
jgi:ketosteroid isomerase-like protein